jgi:hypothetical protein
MRSKHISIILLFLCSGFMLPIEDEFIVRLKKNIEAYNKKYSPVSLKLFFNQPTYAAGDTILFSSVYVKTGSGEGVAGKQIANLILYDDHGRAALHEKFLIKDGFSGHRLTVPGDLSPGIYTLVAYTRWMRNFPSQLFFQRQMKIVGQQSRVLQRQPENFTVSVFPEGGNWIENVSNHLVFQVPAEFASIQGLVKNGETTVATLRFDGHGYADAIMPATSSMGEWHFETVINGQPKSISLPQPVKQGFALRASLTENSNVNILFSKDMKSDTRTFYLAVCSPESLTFYKQIDLTLDSVSILIPKRCVGGIAMISIISNDGKVWANRMMCAGFAESNYSIEFQNDRHIYGVREPIRQTIVLKDGQGNEISGNMSVRIFNQDLFQNENTAEPNPDLVAITLKEGWMDWQKIFSPAIPDAAYQPQHNLVISGKAMIAGTQQPLRDSTMLMFFLQHEIFGYHVYTKNGEFKVPLWFDLFADDEIFYAASYKGKDFPNIELKFNNDSIQENSSFRGMRSQNEIKEDRYGSYFEKKKMVDQSFSYFSTPSSAVVADPNFLYEDELGGADITVNLKDYVVFPTMQDVIREIVTAVEYRKIAGEDVMRVYTTHKRPLNFAQPIYIIDGVLTKSTKTFINLNPEDVIALKVIKDGNKLTRLGALFDKGVILVRTKKTTQTRIVSENIYPIKGLLKPYVPLEQQPKIKTIPDLRPFLYWSPTVLLDDGQKSTFNFSTSDDIGNFKMEIQGVTSDGEFFRGEHLFQTQLTSH